MNLDKVKKTLERRYEVRRVGRENRRKSNLSKIKNHINDFIGEFPPVAKVIVFGSLTRIGYFTELSDIDIAILGLPNSEYWQAIAWFEDCLQTENIDLIRIEDAGPRILKYIHQGTIVYEK